MKKVIQYGMSILCLNILMCSVWADWAEVEAKAKGQVVHFNAWGGGENINAYIDWAAKQVQQRYGVEVKHVKITDAASMVKRVTTEKESGRDANGSVDLMWINGENFRALKSASALLGSWVKELPNWDYVDKNKPIEQDFSISTDGLEAPWGMAQLIFMADRNVLPEPPLSAQALLALAKQYKGRITYPKPPAFHGTTLLKQLLIELSQQDPALQQAVTDADLRRLTPVLWDYLDQLHAVAWREGKAFPSSQAEMTQMLADGELILSLSFNPNEAANLIASQRLPESIYSFGFSQGTIANVHFLAIPYNATAKEGAQVVVNFLLSPEAQARKADMSIWGDPTVLDVSKFTAEQQAYLAKPALGALAAPVPTLPEPHASWVDALEKAWLARYGG